MDLLQSPDVSPSLWNGQAVAPVIPTAGAGADDDKLRKAAKDFEGVLLQQVMDSMRGPSSESGLLDGPDGQQVQGIFWTYLSQELGTSGPLGLWKQIYKEMKGMESKVKQP